MLRKCVMLKVTVIAGALSLVLGACATRYEWREVEGVPQCFAVEPIWGATPVAPDICMRKVERR